MQRTLVAALIAAIVFAAGGWLLGSREAKVVIAKHEHKGQDCKGKGSCKIDVKVDNCDPKNPDPAACDVYAVQEVTLIDAMNKKLDFSIATKDFRFDQTDGIKFDPVNSGDQYFKCKPQGDNYSCDVAIPSGTRSFYKYVIHVEKLDPVDPWVINN